MDAERKTQVITADNPEELRKKVREEIISQGWEVDGGEYKNSDGTYSQKMVK